MCWHLALKGGQCLSQLSVRTRLARPEVDPKRSIFSGTTGLSGAAVNIPAPGDLEADETRGHDGQLELSFQESTRNSTGPEVDLPPCALRHRMLDQNVADLQAARRLEHTRHLRQADTLVGHQVEHAVADDHLSPAVINRQR